MNSVRHAMRIARRYAEGGSDDDVPPGGTPPGPQLGPHLGRVLEMQPLSPDKPSETHGTMHTPYMPIPRGEPPPEAAPVAKPPEETPEATQARRTQAIKDWPQAVADHLVSRHGDDYPAAEEAIRDIGTNYSQRAADAVWSKMPLEHQMGMMDARMQDDLGPAAYRMATDPENWRVSPEKQEATQQEWNRVLAKPTTEQDRQEARGWLGELLRRNAAANSLPEGYTIQPGAAGLTNVMHPNGSIYAQGMNQEQAIDNAIELGRVRNNPDFANILRPASMWDEYRAAQARQAQAVSRGFAESPTGNIEAWLRGASINGVRNLHDDDLQEVIDYFDKNPNEAARRPSLHDAAEAEDSVRAAAHEAMSSAERLGEDEERVPVRTAPPQGVSRSGYVSPYGIHTQQQEPPEPTSEADYYTNDSNDWGHNYLGEVPRESHPFFDATKKAMDDFQTHLRPKVGNINEFAKEFFAGYDTRGINFANEHGDMSWDGTLMDKGKPVGDFSISINSATNSAHLGLMELDRNYRGVAGPKLLRNQIDMYKKMGLDYVDLYAAGGGDPYGGSYAWAKYGFVPNKEDWNLMRARYGQRLNSEAFKPADPEVTTIVKNILSDPDPHAVWRLSDVTAPAANGKPIGKSLLLSMGWSGQLTFKDTAAMERFDAYLKRPKKTKPAN